MSGPETELLLVALAAMVSPTTLSFSVFVLVLAERPRRSGTWFYLGALSATMLVGVLGAFVLGDAAMSRSGGQKTWVSIFDVAAGAALLSYAARVARRPLDPAREERMVARMRGVASTGNAATFVAGAMLANAGAFMPVALKDISQLEPTPSRYLVLWTSFALVSLLPLATGLVVLVTAPDRASQLLGASRAWLERRVNLVGALLMLVLGVVLLRNGIAGLTG